VPVIEAVADVVAGTITPTQALERLMEITTKAENFIR
jgi:glycerol-3-phosphate dehydrogenase (NAD(P)+)